MFSAFVIIIAVATHSIPYLRKKESLWRKVLSVPIINLYFGAIRLITAIISLLKK
jgi:hypothetical protein